METTKLVIIGFLFLLFIQQICAVSISCRDCDVKDCKCSTDCSSGFMIVYLEKCQGTPKYEVSIISGAVNWQPTIRGMYYTKLLCDNGEKSDCETIIVPTKIAEQIPNENSFQYVILLAFVLILAFLVYRYFVRE